MNKKTLFVICSFIGFCLIMLGLNYASVPIRTSEDILGDLNCDGIVDESDLIICGDAYGSKTGQQRWDERADIYGPDKVPDDLANVYDLATIGKYFGDTNRQWISLLTILNQMFGEHRFVVIAFGLYISFVFFMLRGKKLVVYVVYVKNYIFRSLRQYIRI